MFNIGKGKKSTPAVEAKQDDPVTTLAHEPVTHLEHYLAYYVAQLEPGYAVLVTGGWGSGKTHQIKAALLPDHAYYVSLFGLNSPEEIEGQIFAAMYPGKAAIKKIAEKVDSVSLDIPVWGSLGTGGLTSALTSIFIKNEVNTSKPLIFDDLERSTVQIKTLLGLINRFVEHRMCRVIVIAHDTKIVQDFIEAKEKIFGQTLVVEPNVEAAFEAFVAKFSRIDEPAEVQGLRGEILTVFRQSGADSLRVLRHVVEDFGRLAAVLEPRHLANSAAMLELVQLFSACAIEVRHGHLAREDLTSRGERLSHHRFSASAGKGPFLPIVEASSKYPSIDLGSSMLKDGDLIEMLIEGRFVAENIRRSIDASTYFVTKEATPPWQLVVDFDKLDDEIVDRALERMEEQFAKRAIFDSGELLHVVALKMLMAFKGLTNHSVAEVKRASIQYIDDQLRQNLLPPRPAGFGWLDSFDSSWGGVSYWVTPDYRDEFQEVFNHLIRARSKALENQFPDLIPRLLDVMRTNGQGFFELVCYMRNAKTEFEDVPILAQVAPRDFVDAWLASPKTGWYWIGSALKERAKSAPNYPALKSEIAWYPKVVEEMEARARTVNGLARLRMERAASLVGIAKLPPDMSNAKSPV